MKRKRLTVGRDAEGNLDINEDINQSDEMEDDDLDNSESLPTHAAELAYIPGTSRPLEEGEELVMDKSAYRLYYQLQVESASLSFDILLDNLGYDRSVDIDGAPATLFLLAGTQAVQQVKNKLVLMKLSNLRPMTKKDVDKSNDDDESSEDEDDEDDELKPEIEAVSIPHNGTVNRVRAQQYNGMYYAASWSELGLVNIWDLTRPFTAVNDSTVMAEYTKNEESTLPVTTFRGHKSEGYAVAWSTNAGATGVLATGDCTGAIHIWSPGPGGWIVSPTPLSGHTGSVEDIQWSPTEPTVLMSASADGDLRVWDTRAPAGAGSQIRVPLAHGPGIDINVIAWSPLQTANLLSGGDDGVVKVWDLRLMCKRYSTNGDTVDDQIPCYTHSFNFHKKPITSLEWHPTEQGVFVATSEDDQLSLWDITLEQDAGETMVTATNGNETDAAAVAMECSGDDDVIKQLPVQLLFVHAGQHEIKEAHWHAQVPGLVVSTALDGFNVFRTVNI